MFNIFVMLKLAIEHLEQLLICSEKYASRWFIGLSFVKQQYGMKIDLTFEIRTFCDLGMLAVDTVVHQNDLSAVRILLNSEL